MVAVVMSFTHVKITNKVIYIQAMALINFW